MAVELIPPGQGVASPTVVTIGSFDGVHRGHRRLIERARHIAQREGWRLLVVTFDPHPRVFLTRTEDRFLITPLSLKLSIMESLGVPAVKVLPFDATLASMSPEAFLEEELLQRLKVRFVVIGDSFTFGQGGAGTSDTLKHWAPDHGVGVDVIAPVTLPDGVVVSSSWIRQQIVAGAIGAVNEALGHPFEVGGIVVHGDGRGGRIGFPTANLLVDPLQVMPPYGVYAGYAEVPQGRFPAVANWGTRPTFDGVAARLEVHLLHYTGDLTGQFLRFRVTDRLRGELRFDSVEALVAQIRRDAAQATGILQEREKVARENPPC